MKQGEAIVLRNLSKRYGRAPQLALDNVSLSVRHGEVYGFLGANGAGKSTAIRVLLNFLQPTGGTAQILGKDIVHDSVAIHHKVGYLSGDVALYDKLTGKQFLDYMAALHPLPQPAYRRELEKDFEADLHKPIGTLSKGNRQKIGIIQALMHEPEVLILDEPTSGLDPAMQEVFFTAVRAAQARGGSVFFSSHNLAEVKDICDRVGFISQGRLVREQNLSELASAAAHVFDVTFEEAPPLKPLKAIPHARVHAGTAPHEVVVSVPTDMLTAFFAILGKHNIKQFQQRDVSLEDEFMQFYREAHNEKA